MPCSPGRCPAEPRPTEPLNWSSLVIGAESLAGGRIPDGYDLYGCSGAPGAD